jgi:hypothetical protein
MLREYLGFTDVVSTVLWVLVAGVVIVVALVRTPLFTASGMRAFAPPGEEFSLRPVRSTFHAHLALIIPWCILGAFQFVPSIRKSLSFTYHRLAGRAFLVISLAVAATGLSVAKNAFGGSFVSLVGLFTLSLSFVFAIFFGYRAVLRKDFPSHRDWMIRLFSYGTSVITLRLFMFTGLAITARLKMWTTSKCDVLESLLGDGTAAAFPACLSSTGSIDPDAIVSVQASFKSSANVMASFHLSYDASIILALLLHATFAELWIRKRYYRRTEDSLYSSVAIEVTEKTGP